MKKPTWIIIFFICQLLSLPSFAYVSGKVIKEEKPIYCPSQINCSRTQCDLSPENAQYFSLPPDATKCVDANKFKSAEAGFHSSYSGGYCWYEGAHVGSCSGIKLSIKPQTNLEAYYQKSSAWVFADKSVTCTASSPSSCPLKERLGFVIHNFNISGGVFASINGQDISQSIAPGSYTSIIYDDTLVGCSSERQCTINILSGKHIKYGSIKVDMDSMKILNVNSDYPTKIQINKLDSFNTIELSYPSKK